MKKCSPEIYQFELTDPVLCSRTGILCTYNKEVFLFSAYIQQTWMLDSWRQHFSMQNRCVLNTKQTSPVFALAFKWKLYLAFSKVYLTGRKVCSKLLCIKYHHLELILTMSTIILVFKKLCTYYYFFPEMWSFQNLSQNR